MSAYGRFQKGQREAAAKEARELADYLASGDDHLEAAADMATERAARNFLAYDAEAYDEMARDDLMGKS